MTTKGEVSAEPTAIAPPAPALSCRPDVALRGLYELAKILAAPGRLDEVFSRTLGLLSSFLDMRRSVIALAGPDGALVPVVGYGGFPVGPDAAALPEALLGRLATARTPQIFDAEDFVADWPQGASEDAILLAALAEQDGLANAALILERDARSASDDEDARFLGMIVTMIGQTVHTHERIARDRARLMDDQRRLEKQESRGQANGEPALLGQTLIGIIGASRAIREVFSQINVAARTHTTILLRGESGTGKELFARAAHDLSPRKNGPFIRLNCAALPENMLESELFGHEKGAFTGAIGQRKGRFELADHGTLFLDEIGEISAAFQAKLLRVLQEGEFERVGGAQTVKVDVRFVFATNKNLEAAVAAGSFRADLYYRINVVSILLPPLRERPDDIALLAQEFLRRFNEENGARKKLTPAALRLLQNCNFPGNVRELENCVRRAATFARDEALTEQDFGCTAGDCLSSTLGPAFSTPGARTAKIGVAAWENHYFDSEAGRRAAAAAATRPEPMRARAARRASLTGVGANEREALIEAMEKAGWVQAKAARLLNLTPRQIAYALVKHQIEIKKF